MKALILLLFNPDVEETPFLISVFIKFKIFSLILSSLKSSNIGLFSLSCIHMTSMAIFDEFVKILAFTIFIYIEHNAPVNLAKSPLLSLDIIETSVASVPFLL